MNDQTLRVVGRGAVSPAGWGIDPLWSAAEVADQSMQSLSRPGQELPVRRVDRKTPAWSKWQSVPRLRRASPLAYYLADAAAQALEECPAARAGRLGMVVAMGTGSIVYSRRFFQDFREKGRRFASPVLFPETVYNSPVSHLAQVLDLKGPCYTIVGDDSAWVEGIRIADLWLGLGEADDVLVIGGEELDEAAVEAYDCAGWYRSNPNFRPAEGAAALLLTHRTQEPKFVLSRAQAGGNYRTRAEARLRARDLADKIGPGEAVFQTARYNWWRRIEEGCIPYGCTSVTGLQIGEAFSASAGWHTLQASRHLLHGQSVFMPVWGLNQSVGFLRLEGAQS